VDYEYGIIDLPLGIAMGPAKSGVMNAHAGQDLTITKAVILKPCTRLSSDFTLFLSFARALRACLHVVSRVVLLPVRTCGREKETEKDRARYGHSGSA
jgi:hypothetical protein